MSMVSNDWYALDVELEPAAQEAVQYALMEAGALGTETNNHVVTGYFSATPNRERVRDELFEALRERGKAKHGLSILCPARIS